MRLQSTQATILSQYHPHPQSVPSTALYDINWTSRHRRRREGLAWPSKTHAARKSRPRQPGRRGCRGKRSLVRWARPAARHGPPLEHYWMLGAGWARPAARQDRPPGTLRYTERELQSHLTVVGRPPIAAFRHPPLHSYWPPPISQPRRPLDAPDVEPYVKLWLPPGREPGPAGSRGSMARSGPPLLRRAAALRGWARPPLLRRAAALWGCARPPPVREQALPSAPHAAPRGELPATWRKGCRPHPSRPPPPRPTPPRAPPAWAVPSLAQPQAPPAARRAVRPTPAPARWQPAPLGRAGVGRGGRVRARARAGVGVGRAAPGACS
jgi:hypothetical protein